MSKGGKEGETAARLPHKAGLQEDAPNSSGPNGNDISCLHGHQTGFIVTLDEYLPWLAGETAQQAKAPKTAKVAGKPDHPYGGSGTSTPAS